MNNTLEKVKPYLASLRRFDFYPKTESDIQVRSSYGGIGMLINFILKHYC